MCGPTKTGFLNDAHVTVTSKLLKHLSQNDLDLLEMCKLLHTENVNCLNQIEKTN